MSVPATDGPGRIWEPGDLAEAERGLRELWASATKTAVLGASNAPADAVVISPRRLNRILALDLANSATIVEAGVTVDALRVAAAAVGLWCPALRWLRADLTIGAAVAGAHGFRTRRYGAVADYLLGSRFACPGTGVVRHGGMAMKNATGFNLTATLVGTRGTLAVILGANLRLVPLPRHRLLRTYAAPVDQIWRQAAVIAGTAPEARPDEPLWADAVEVGLHFSRPRGHILVEAEDLTVQGLHSRERQLDHLAEQLSLVPAESPDWAAWSLISLARRGAIAPADLADRLGTAIAPMIGAQVDAQIVAEATGGGIEIRGNPAQPSLELLPVASAGARRLWRDLKTAFDPAGLLPDFSNATLP